MAAKRTHNPRTLIGIAFLDSNIDDDLSRLLNEEHKIAEITNAPGHSDLRQKTNAGQGEAAQLQDLVRQIKADQPNADVQYFPSPGAVEQAAKACQGTFILFTNFPPDAGYAGQVMVSRDGVFVPADSYERTTKFYTALLAEYPRIKMHVITGAPVEQLADDEIFKIAPKTKITVQRKNAWFDGDYWREYGKYVAVTVREAPGTT